MSARWQPLDFEARLVHLDGQVVAAVEGEVDVATSDGLWDTVDEALAQSPHLVLHLSETTFMGFAGLAVIVRAHKRQRRPGSVGPGCRW